MARTELSDNDNDKRHLSGKTEPSKPSHRHKHSHDKHHDVHSAHRRKGKCHHSPSSSSSSSSPSSTDTEKGDNKIKMLPSAKTGHVPKAEESLTGPENYLSWCQRVRWLFTTNNVDEYVKGKVSKPNPTLYPVSAYNWKCNDALACSIITNNIQSTQLKHTQPCTTSNEMWNALRKLHESGGKTTLTNYMTILFQTCTTNNDKILKHLDTLKDTWECINTLASKHLHISDKLFKVVISISLPHSWDVFTNKFVNDPKDEEDQPKKCADSQTFIGAIVSEYRLRATRISTGKASNIAYRGQRRIPDPQG